MRKPLSRLLFQGGKLLGRLAIAEVLAAIVLLCACALTQEDFLPALTTFIAGPLEDAYEIGEILRESLPLMFTGVAVSLMVRCGQFNMFVEGAFYGGAFVAAVLAPMLGEMPFLTPFIAIVAAAAAMALLGTGPALMKSRLGVNEFVSSLMLNYIVYWLVMYLLHGAAGDPDYVNATLYLEDGMRLPFLAEDMELSLGLVLGLVTAAACGIVLFKTKWGYALKTTGNNPLFARYVGIREGKYIAGSQIAGAGIAGMGGAIFLLSHFYRFQWTSLPNYGFDGFVIAIIASNNPLMVPLAALFLGYLRVGALQVSRMGSIPNEVIYVIQALIIILFGARFLMRQKGGKHHA